MHFVFYRYCCEGQCPVSNHLKCPEKSGNLISASVSLHMRGFMVLYKFVFNFNFSGHPVLGYWIIRLTDERTRVKVRVPI